MIRKLPVYKGYTVDARLKHFRKIKKQSNLFAGMEYIDFDSEKGDKLLSSYIKKLDVESVEFKEISLAIC